MIKLNWIRDNRSNVRMLEREKIESLFKEIADEETTAFLEAISDANSIYINFDRDRKKESTRLWINKGDSELEKAVTVQRDGKVFSRLDKYCR